MNLQDEIHEMISDYHYDIRIWPRLHILLFFKVFHKEDSRKNHQKDVITYDREGSIDRRHGPEIERRLAIRGAWSYYLFHYAMQ